MTSRFDLLSGTDFPLGRLDPRWKLSATLLAMVAVLFLRSPLSLSLAFAGSLGLTVWSRVLWRSLVTRLGAVALVLLPFAALLPFLGAGADYPWWIPLAQLYLKAMSIVTLAMVILSTTSLMTNLKAARALRMPSLPLHLLMLTYRYVFLLSQEFLRMRIAVRVRGFRPRANRHTYRTTAHLAGTLLVRGYERAETVGQAMRCRGFAGKFHSLAQFQTRGVDLTFFFLVVGFSAVLLIWDNTQF